MVPLNPTVEAIRKAVPWGVVTLLAVVPVVVAAASPLNAGRAPIWIAGSMAGIVALSLMLLQPLLASGRLAGLEGRRGRNWHRLAGYAVLAAVFAHVAGLFIYSPEDILDALLLVAPTPFSVYGVASALLLVVIAVTAATRQRLRISYLVWQALHAVAASMVVAMAVAHTLMIAGVMGEYSKLAICLAALGATVTVAISKALLPLVRQVTRKQQSG